MCSTVLRQLLLLLLLQSLAPIADQTGCDHKVCSGGPGAYNNHVVCFLRENSSVHIFVNLSLKYYLPDQIKLLHYYILYINQQLHHANFSHCRNCKSGAACRHQLYHSAGVTDWLNVVWCSAAHVAPVSNGYLKELNSGEV